MHASTRIAVAIAFFVVVLASACKTRNPNHCEGAPHDNCWYLDGGNLGCADSSDCPEAAPVCDVGTRTCVQCTEAEPRACGGTTPVCRGTTCQGCRSHGECRASGSEVCLPDGACADPALVAYVAPAPAGTDNASCSRTQPCTKVASALATRRPYVKLSGTTDEPVTVTGGQVVTFFGEPGAKLTRGSGTGPIVTVTQDGTALTVYDLTISDAPNNPSGIGILVPPGSGAPIVSLARTTVTNNPAGGIVVSGGTLTVTASTISANDGGGIHASGGTLTVTASTIAANDGGGIDATGIVSLTNNFIHHNGNTVTASVGGLMLRPEGASRVEFNTIIDNLAITAGTTSVGGVSCDEPAFVVRGNIIFRNTGGAGGKVQTFGSCTYGDSFVMPGTSPGDESLSFVRSNEPPYDYHLTAASPITVVGAAGPCTGTDFDGEVRPSGGACELGADELPP